MIRASNLWLPDLAIVNGADSSKFLSTPASTYAVVSHEGTVHVVYSLTSVKTKCELSVRYFPFDKQSCAISLSSWTLSASMFNVSTANSTVLSDF